MKIAIPVVNNKLSMHFGHCQSFVIMDIDQETKKLISQTELQSPPHQPGLLPQWLADHKVNLIIAAGMGQRAQSLFQNNNIQVIVGAENKTPAEILEDYLNSKLVVSENFCDH